MLAVIAHCVDTVQHPVARPRRSAQQGIPGRFDWSVAPLIPPIKSAPGGQVVTYAAGQKQSDSVSNITSYRHF